MTSDSTSIGEIRRRELDKLDELRSHVELARCAVEAARQTGNILKIDMATEHLGVVAARVRGQEARVREFEVGAPIDLLMGDQYR